MLALIAAVAQNGVIGKDGALPWHLSEDLKYFKATTLHHCILMGRKTFDSIGKPLAQRKNIVITRNTSWHYPGCQVFRSITEALSATKDCEKRFVIGGAEIFMQTFPLATYLYITEIKQAFTGNIFFPYYQKMAWQEISRIPKQEHNICFDFVIYKRK